MPRAKKTQSGAPASPAVPAVDVPYGEGESRIESQRRMPVPSGPPPTPGGASAGPGPSPTGGPGPAAIDPRARVQQALVAMQRMQPPGGLTAPTQRPNEPLQSGMPFGPGAGPEVLRTGDRVSRTLRLIADLTDDPGFSQLADLAASRGR